MRSAIIIFLAYLAGSRDTILGDLLILLIPTLDWLYCFFFLLCVFSCLMADYMHDQGEMRRRRWRREIGECREHQEEEA
ncbi:hypothetical protein DFH27DRAFT_190589 [Peziza echinospora]|nr:hypothetical protein DFH27DRAFT_190589 [Peziza echinospora]